MHRLKRRYNRLPIYVRGCLEMAIAFVLLWAWLILVFSGGLPE